MKPIKWTKRDRLDHVATVEGVKVSRRKFALSFLMLAPLGNGAWAEVRVPHLNRQQIDAAAYALADLVQTLRGLE